MMLPSRRGLVVWTLVARFQFALGDRLCSGEPVSSDIAGAIERLRLSIEASESKDASLDPLISALQNWNDERGIEEDSAPARDEKLTSMAMKLMSALSGAASVGLKFAATAGAAAGTVGVASALVGLLPSLLAGAVFFSSDSNTGHKTLLLQIMSVLNSMMEKMAMESLRATIVTANVRVVHLEDKWAQLQSALSGGKQTSGNICQTMFRSMFDANEQAHQAMILLLQEATSLFQKAERPGELSGTPEHQSYTQAFITDIHHQALERMRMVWLLIAMRRVALLHVLIDESRCGTFDRQVEAYESLRHLLLDLTIDGMPVPSEMSRLSAFNTQLDAWRTRNSKDLTAMKQYNQGWNHHRKIKVSYSSSRIAKYLVLCGGDYEMVPQMLSHGFPVWTRLNMIRDPWYISHCPGLDAKKPLQLPDKLWCVGGFTIGASNGGFQIGEWPHEGIFNGMYTLNETLPSTEKLG